MQIYSFFLYLCIFIIVGIIFFMRLKTIIFVLIALTFAQSCKKEDFEALRYPLVIEGDFNPVLDIPVVKKTITVSDIVGLVDPSEKVDMTIAPDGLVSLHFDDTLHSVYDYSDCKSLQSYQVGDSLYIPYIITGKLNIPLFDSLRHIGTEYLKVKGMYISINTNIIGAQNRNTGITFNHDLNIHLDSIAIRIDCHDGFRPLIPVADNEPVIDEQALLNGYHITLLDNYDISPIINRFPKLVRYTIRMTTAIPLGDWYEGSAEPYFRSLGLDSVIANTYCSAAFPLQLYCNEMEFSDTASWQPAGSLPNDSIMHEIERYLTLDSSSYLVLDCRNYIPLTTYMNILLLDSNMHTLSSPLLSTNNTMAGAPIRLMERSESYQSDGFTKSNIILPIDWQLYEQLKQTRFIRYTLKFSTSTLGARESYPTVAIHKDDRLELRARVVLAPHIHFVTDPIEIK